MSAQNPSPPQSPSRGSAGLIAALVVMGAGWGITQPLSKIAVEAGYRPFGLIFAQFAIGALILGGLVLLRRQSLPVTRATLRVYLAIALIGTIFPNSASYIAIDKLPSGIISILLSSIPMLAFPIALALGLERFRVRRLAGLGLGLCGVLLLVGPDAALPEAGMVKWLPVAMVAPLFYAFEGNYVARWGTAGLDPVQVLAGASILGAGVSLPMALISGQWIDPRPPWGIEDLSVLGIGGIHAAGYAAYVWLVGRAGPVFAVQVSYLVTGFGVFWAMILLGERLSPLAWAALVLMLAGVALVQPRRGTAAPA